MECQSYLNAPVLPEFIEISDVDLENFLSLDLPDIDFDAFLNLDLAEKDTDRSDSDGKLAFPSLSPAPSGEVHEEMNVIDPLLASYAWTEGNIVKPQSPADDQLTAPQAYMSDYQNMHSWTPGHALIPQPIPGVMYNSQGCVDLPAECRERWPSKWVPCSPPPQLSNAYSASQSAPIIAGGYLPGYPGKQILPFTEGLLGSHLPSMTPQMRNPTLMQSIPGSNLDATNRLQGQGKTLPIRPSPEAEKESPIPKSMAIAHQPSPKSSSNSLPHKPLLLTKPNPRYTPHPAYIPLPHPPPPPGPSTPTPATANSPLPASTPPPN